MNLTDIPTLIAVPFASSGLKNTVPVPASGTPGVASYTTGFPADTFDPIASGGIPPDGKDVNGVYYDLSTANRWGQAGGQYYFNSTFATAITGYPKGAILNRSDSKGQWQNLVDGNTTDPDSTSAANWVAVRSNMLITSIAVAAGATTPTLEKLGAALINVTGAIASAATLVLPLTAGASWIVRNSTTGAGTFTVVGATGTGATIPQGVAYNVYTDGVNFYASSADASGLYLPIGGTAVAAVKLAAARNFSISGLATASAVAFDGTGNVVLNVTALAPTGAEINAGLGYVAADDSTVVHTTGTETVAGAKTFSNVLTVNNVTQVNTSGSQASVLVTDTGTFGANIGLAGNGGTTPNKSIRAFNGSFQVMAHLYAAVIFSVDNSGNVTIPGGYTAATNSTFTAGLNCAATVASNVTDLTRQISLFNNQYGFSVTSTRLNYVAPTGGTHRMTVGGTDVLTVAAGAVTVAGSITCTTMNATGSDERLKTDITEVAPRPLHRFTPYVAYVHKEDGKDRRGRIAQQLEKYAPEHMGSDIHLDKNQIPGIGEGDYKTVDMTGVAHEIATWAAMELDKQTKIIVAMQRAALAQQQTIQLLLNRLAKVEAAQETK